MAFSTLSDSEITIENVNEALKEILSANKNKILDSKAIINTVARYFGIRPEDFKSKKRSRDIAYPRQIAMFLCRELTDLSLPKIGDIFGGRDHSTVIHACDKISEEKEQNNETRRAIEELRRNLTG